MVSFLYGVSYPFQQGMCHISGEGPFREFCCVRLAEWIYKYSACYRCKPYIILVQPAADVILKRAIFYGENIHLPVYGFLSVIREMQQILQSCAKVFVWDHLDRERNKGQPKSKEELSEVLKEA